MNTDIWEKLEETDPEFTKGFKKGGGFSGTSINPTYGIKKLTELFGPCGVGWGDKIIESRFDEGHFIIDPKTKEETKNRETIHTIILEVWYKREGDIERNYVIGVGTTTYIGSNKYGLFTDEEYFKKTMTDALTNASKKLGLSADIFMGKYDNQKYIAEMKDKFGDLPKRAKIAKELLDCKTMDEYKVIYNNFLEQFSPEGFQLLSGKQGKDNNETWSDVFTAAFNRIKGINPFDANKIPDKTQDEFDAIVKTCSDKETLEVLRKLMEDYPELDIEPNAEAIAVLSQAYD